MGSSSPLRRTRRARRRSDSAGGDAIRSPALPLRLVAIALWWTARTSSPPQGHPGAASAFVVVPRTIAGAPHGAASAAAAARDGRGTPAPLRRAEGRAGAEGGAKVPPAERSSVLGDRRAPARACGAVAGGGLSGDGDAAAALVGGAAPSDAPPSPSPRPPGRRAQRDALPPSPSSYYGTSDADFAAWFSSLLSSSPLRSQYPHVFNLAVRAVLSWRRRYRGNPGLWRRIFKAERVAKELVEAVPVIDAALKIAEEYEPNEGADGGGKITVVDLASGKGYLSMFLSEMLPPEKVEKFVLVDKAWPMCGAGEVLPHQMSWDHIYGNVTEYARDDDGGGNASGAADGTIDTDGDGGIGRFVETGGTYFSTWPIPLHTSKQDLKQKCTARQMKKRLFAAAPGPILILAVHLCGALSLRAVDMFNDHGNVSFLALKPCCLPPMIYANRGEVFALGRHRFEAREVCANGRFKGNRWYGPPRWHLEGRFRSWADHLYLGVDVGSEIEGEKGERDGVDADVVAENSGDGGRKRKFDVDVQVEGGFQNTYVFAQRRPITESVWEDGVGSGVECRM